MVNFSLNKVCEACQTRQLNLNVRYGSAAGCLISRDCIVERNMPIDHKKIGRGWLHLPIEWYSREFPSKLLLALFSSSRGYKVTIGDQKIYRKNIHRIPLGIFFRKSFRPNQIDEITALQNAGFTVIGGDEEAFALYGNSGIRKTNIRFNKQTVDNVRGIFVWGECLKSELVDTYPDIEKKVHVTGSSRLDLYRPEFRHIYEADAEFYKRQYGKFLLFNSNFSMSTSEKTANSVKNDYKTHYHLSVFESKDLITWEDGEKYFYKYHEYLNRVLSKFLEAIPKIVSAFPDYTLVIRPHPADQMDFWYDVARQATSVVVVRENHVAPWLLASEAMFHHGCSTAIEGWVLGTPVVGYHPGGAEEFNEIGGRVGYNSATIDELIGKLRSVAGKRDVQREGHEWMEDYFAGVTGRTASERTVDALDQFDVKPDENRYSEILPWAELRGGKRLERQWRYFRDRYLKRPPRTVKMGSSWRPQPKWPEAKSVGDIEQMIAKYAVGYPEFASIRVSQLDDQLFIIEK